MPRIPRRCHILVKVDYQDVAENLRESFRIIASSREPGEVREFPGVSIASAGATFEMFNAAFLSGPVHSARELAQRISIAAVHFQARGLKWAYWVCEDWLSPEARRRSRRAFEEHGLRYAVELPGMLAEEIAPPCTVLPRIEVRRVRDAGTRDAFCAIGSTCFNVPLAWFKEVFDGKAVWNRFWSYVGYVNGEPVCTTAIIMSGDALGVYNVGTLPGNRRLGYAEALMRHALEDSRRQCGIERSILQSTPAGLRLYERMGYRKVSTVAVYSV